MTTLLDVTNAAVPQGKVKVPPRPAAQPRSPISVNGVEISEEAIRTEAQNHPAPKPAEAFAEAARALVVRELLLHEARARQVAAKPEVVGDGLTETEEEAAIRALLAEEVATPTATESDCERYYAANRDKFRSDAIFEARHILFAAAPEDKEARAAARLAAESVIAELIENPARFAELAKAHSACPSRAQGGNLGQLSRGSTVPEFETVLFNLEPGQLSPAPVPTPFGFHIIQLDRKIEGEQLPFELVKGRIAAWLEASSWSRAMAQYVGILAGKAKITGIDMHASDSPLVQ